VKTEAPLDAPDFTQCPGGDFLAPGIDVGAQGAQSMLDVLGLGAESVPDAVEPLAARPLRFGDLPHAGLDRQQDLEVGSRVHFRRSNILSVHGTSQVAQATRHGQALDLSGVFEGLALDL
jgi:hypothetical protein